MPKLDMLRKIAAVLGCRPYELIAEPCDLHIVMPTPAAPIYDNDLDAIEWRTH